MKTKRKKITNNIFPIFFKLKRNRKKIFLTKDPLLIYLSSAFVVIFFLIFLSNQRQPAKSSVLSYQMDYKKIPLEDKVFVLRPVLKEGIFSFPVLSAQSVIAIDLESNTSLYEKNPDLSLLPASITKLVTALVALESFDINTVLTFNGENIDGQKMGLVKGESLKVIDLINALLVYSANDAAYLLAESYPGGVESFVLAMNQKAQDLGAFNTHFENPTGFDGGSHKTTARDLVAIAKAALENQDILSIVQKKEVDIESVDGKMKHHLVNTNKLLGEVEGVLGLKTGWTENARENLITYYNKNGHRLLIILLGSQDRFGETKELLNWINSSFDWLWVEVKS